MPLKESSDELNPAVLVAEPLPLTQNRGSFSDYLALGISTCGVGYLPLAPGTWGSLLAVAGFLAARLLITPLSNPINFLAGHFVAIVIVTIIGIWSASRTERVLNLKDPGKVVIDEVAGQLIALAPLCDTRKPLLVLPVMVAFVLFRLFDIVKPYPARKLESLKGGWGIMADDLIAGVYAAVGVGLLLFLVR